MTELLRELEAVVGLAEKATPGRLEPELAEAYNVRADHGGIFAQIHNLKGRHGLGGRVHGDEAAANARLIAAAVNFIRTHHAEIAEALKDARRYRNTRAALYQENIAIGEAELVLRVYEACPSIEQFDAAIDAHNSAREVGE